MYGPNFTVSTLAEWYNTLTVPARNGIKTVREADDRYVTTNGVSPYVVRMHHLGVLYCHGVKRFHGARVSAISFTPTRKLRPSFHRLEPGSAVGIATGYGLDGPGIESRWGGGRDFPHLFRPVLGPTQPPVQ
jgi:hypothetical protein